LIGQSSGKGDEEPRAVLAEVLSYATVTLLLPMVDRARRAVWMSVAWVLVVLLRVMAAVVWPS
jgi:hypothetical protein